MSRRWKIVAAAVAALLAVPAVAAPVPKPGESAVGKARAALNKTVTAKGDPKTFTETIDLFKDLAKVEITLDTAAIQMMGIDPNQPVVKFDVKDAKLKDAVKAAFGPYNLRIGVTASGLFVSTEEGLTARQLRERVDVAADGRPLADVLRGLAEQTGATVVFDPRAKKLLTEEKVTLALDDVPLETAVRLSAEVAGAGVVRMGNVLFVTTEARADKLRADADRPVGPAQTNPFGIGIDGPGGIIGGGIGFPGAGGGGVVPPPPPVQVAPPPPVDLPAKKDEKKDN